MLRDLLTTPFWEWTTEQWDHYGYFCLACFTAYVAMSSITGFALVCLCALVWLLWWDSTHDE